MVDVGLEPTTQKPMVLPTTPFICEGARGVLVRLTTCKGLTNSLPKLSLLITPHHRLHLENHAYSNPYT